MRSRVIGFRRLAADQFLLLDRAQTITITDEKRSVQTRVDILLAPKHELDIFLQHLIDEKGFIYEGNVVLAIEEGDTYELVAYAAPGTDVPAEIRLGSQAKNKIHALHIAASSLEESLQWDAPKVWGTDEPVVWEVRHDN